MRTARRSRIRRASSSGRKLSSRVHRPTYGGLGAWACMPTRCSIASVAESSQRRSSSWRASSARLSSYGVRTRSATHSPHLSSPPSLLNGFGPDQASLARARSGRLFGCESVAGVLPRLGPYGAVRSAAGLRIFALGGWPAAGCRLLIDQVDAGDDQDDADDEGNAKRLAQEQRPDENGDERDEEDVGRYPARLAGPHKPEPEQPGESGSDDRRVQQARDEGAVPGYLRGRLHHEAEGREYGASEEERDRHGPEGGDALLRPLEVDGARS